MFETIKYNKVDPVIWWAQIFITFATIKFTFSFINKLIIPRSLVWSAYFIKYHQSIVKTIIVGFKKVQSRIIFIFSLTLILILKSFVNTGSGVLPNDSSCSINFNYKVSISSLQCFLVPVSL